METAWSYATKALVLPHQTVPPTEVYISSDVLYRKRANDYTPNINNHSLTIYEELYSNTETTGPLIAPQMVWALIRSAATSSPIY